MCMYIQKVIQSVQLQISHQMKPFQESAKLRALRAKNVLKCHRSLRAHVRTCRACLRASFVATIFSFAAIVAEVVPTVGKV